MAESTPELPPDFFPTVILGVLGILAAVVAIAALVLFVGWLWGLKDRMPSRLRQIEEEHATALSQAREAAHESASQLRAARNALEEAQATLQGHTTQAAALRAALEENRKAGLQIEDKALQAVAKASGESAALAAEGKRLARDLAAANEAVERKQELLRKLKLAYDDLEIRHGGTLADLTKLRDCQHQEQTTVYTRETDPATGSRPYRSPGSMCKRCHYVLTGPEPAAVPVPVMVAANG